MERLLFARIEVWLAALLTVLMVALLAFWAYAAVAWKVFPYRQVLEVRAFVQGVPGDERSLWTRLRSLGAYSPRTLPAPGRPPLLPDDAFVEIIAAPGATGLPDISGMRVAAPGSEEPRYFLVFGSFAFLEAQETIGSILIDSTGKIYRGWPNTVADSEYLGPHIGLAMSPDGIIATNAKGIMSAQNWCGEKLWQAPWTPHPDGIRRGDSDVDGYDWHHDIDWHDGAFWSLLGSDIAAVDDQTGQITTRVDGMDMVRWGWKDGNSLLDARGPIFNSNRLSLETARELIHVDPFHYNKVQVLSEEQAPDYPGLEPGDILISARNLNLVAIVRPSEERFVWWRYGLTSRQHDATFLDGAIEVYNNAPYLNPPQPTIRRLDFTDHSASTVLDLSQFGSRMRRKGNFARDGDNILVIDDEAGRMIATDPSGTVNVLFENLYTGDGQSGYLQLRNAIEISAADMERLEASCR